MRTTASRSDSGRRRWVPATRGADAERQADDLAAEVLGRTPAQEAAGPEQPPRAAAGVRPPGTGSPLDPALRASMEPRFGHDFGSVRVHQDAGAAESAEAVNAFAYTRGTDIVFNRGQFDPHTRRGRGLLAHELAHVVQQSTTGSPAVQCQGMGDVRLAENNELLRSQIKRTPAFGRLDAARKALTDQILAEIGKRKISEQYDLLTKLKLLFDTPVKPPATITVETQASTQAAVTVEKARLSKPKAKADSSIEERASARQGRSWVPIKGKFGGGTYHVDRTSMSDIVVRAKVQLTTAGTGTQGDIDAIKAMEDGIEKAASTQGYLVDLTFVDVADADTFKVNVDPSKWETATNWSGGDPVGFAHELHHMFAFDLDRYNYIESHAGNEAMEVEDRLHWFREELKKPLGYNDPTSLMNSAQNPNDDDACRTAGLDPAVCVPARVAARKKVGK